MPLYNSIKKSCCNNILVTMGISWGERRVIEDKIAILRYREVFVSISNKSYDYSSNVLK